MAFYVGKPAGHLILSSQHMATTLRRTMGFNITLPGVPCCSTDCPVLDNNELHSRSCMTAKGAANPIHVHNGIAKVFKDYVLTRGLHAPHTTEDATPFTAANLPVDGQPRQGRPFQMDTIVGAGIIQSKRGTPGGGIPPTKAVLIDYTLTEPAGPANIAHHGTPYTPGAAAAHATANKHTHYSRKFDRDSYTLKVFAVESYGRLGVEAEELLQACAYTAAGGAAAFDQNLYGQLIFRWRHAISIYLHRALSVRTLEHLRASLRSVGRMADVMHLT
jgi:hypothetical protein